MTRLFSSLFKPHPPAEPSPRERVLAQRERLLRCALQLLQDPQAALELVLTALGQALHSPLLVQLSGALPPAGAAVPAEPQALNRWLDRLIINLALSRLRAGALPAPLLEGEDPSLAEALRRPGGRDLSQGAASEEERGPRISHHLGRLSPEVRVTLTLSVVQRRPLPEIADLLGCSEASCRFWLVHGRKALRRALQRELLSDSGPLEPRTPVPLGAPHDLRRGKKTSARA